jgi:hypothetical protein
VTAIVPPAGTASMSSALRAVSPFIGNVDASTSVEPAGARATEPAGRTRLSL